MRALWKWSWRILVLSIVYFALFAVGAQVLAPKVPGAETPAESGGLFLGLLGIVVIDVALTVALALTSRLRGWRLILLLCGFFYFVKSLTSQLEAAYFMTNVTPQMLPGLFTMMLPLALLFPPLVVLLTERARGPTESSAWVTPTPPMSRTERWTKIALLSAVAYPVLFFLFGYFVAFQSAELRTFYGVPNPPPFLQHMANLLGGDPLVYPFEALRGLGWVAAALVVMRTTKGPWWVGTLLVSLSFALVQNDVHFVPNPLMPPQVRLFHFLETASSNFLFVWLIGAVMARSHLSRAAALKSTSAPAPRPPLPPSSPRPAC